MSDLLLKDLSSFVLLPAESLDDLTVTPNNVCVCLTVCVWMCVCDYFNCSL